MKARIIEEMKGAGMTGAEADKAFTTTVDALKTVINADKRATIPGLGTFHKKFRPGRTGRNPGTGQPVEIAAKNVVTFKETGGGI